jgi:hypothetical protein
MTWTYLLDISRTMPVAPQGVTTDVSYLSTPIPDALFEELFEELFMIAKTLRSPQTVKSS